MVIKDTTRDEKWTAKIVEHIWINDELTYGVFLYPGSVMILDSKRSIKIDIYSSEKLLLECFKLGIPINKSKVITEAIKMFKGNENENKRS